MDSAALLSNLGNIVDQISGADPEAAGDLTDAVVGALPEDNPDVAGIIPSAQNAVEAETPGELDSIIPSLGGALGEEIELADPIDPSDAPGALGNVVNRGKTIINQINEAMSDNIDPALQDIIDNVSGIVDSAEEQLANPMCLASQVVNGIFNEVLVPCAEAGPGATTTIAHLAPTQNQNPSQSQGPAQPQDGTSLPGVPSHEPEKDSSPGSWSSGSSPGVSQAPGQSGGTGFEGEQQVPESNPPQQSSGPGQGDETGSQTGQQVPQASSPQQPSVPGTPGELLPPVDPENDGEQPPSSGAAPETPQSPSTPVQDGFGNQPSSQNIPSVGQGSSPVSNQGGSSSSGNVQEQPWGSPASNGEGPQGGELPDQGSSHGQGKTTYNNQTLRVLIYSSTIYSRLGTFTGISGNTRFPRLSGQRGPCRSS